MAVLNSVVFFISAFILVEAAESSARAARSVGWSGLNREISCRENLEYLHKTFCCLNCRAGQYVKKSCERPWERGVCEACESGTFTEHPNGLDRCLPCEKCREDQEASQVCTSIKDTECHCKAGTYCVTEEACEVCKKCTKCKEDEEVEKNCTSTSNSACRKKPPSTDPISGSTSSVVIPVVFVFLLLVLIVALVIVWKRRTLKKAKAEIRSSPDEEEKISVDEDCERSVEERQNRLNAGLEVPGQELQPFLMLVGAKPPAVEDEDNGLGDSLSNTTNSSQTSLSTHPIALPSRSPHPSPETQRQPIFREDGTCRRLVPVNGEDSWRETFYIIDRYLAIKYRNRFFRLIGLSDNTIDNQDSSGDRVYNLLKSWMEKEGLTADINNLIRALLQLDQKLSAENVIQEVVDRGYFRFEDESS